MADHRIVKDAFLQGMQAAAEIVALRAAKLAAHLGSETPEVIELRTTAQALLKRTREMMEET